MILSPDPPEPVLAVDRSLVRAGSDARKGDSHSLMNKYLIVGVGGFIGAIARFWVGDYIGNRMGTRFPYGTFIVNCTGSFLVGFILTLLAERIHSSPNWRYLIPIGFIGAYTTFSTFEYEIFRSVQDGELLVAGLNIVLSVIVGFISVWLGVITGTSIL